MATGVVMFVKDLATMSRFYAAVTGLEPVTSDPGHIAIGPGITLVAVPADVAASIEITDPPQRREAAAIKPVLDVASLQALRVALPALGGELNPPSKEWHTDDATICDGNDPEGNVVQFRQRG